MDNYEEREIEISREFDFSNIVVEIQPLMYLVQYCEQLFNQLSAMVNEDEEKNQKLKSEFRNYQYKKAFNSRLEISIKEKGESFRNLTCKNLESFKDAIDNGHLNNVDSLIIVLDLSYKRGKDLSLKDHENVFKISFKPYSIVFSRKSNYDEANMNSIENYIKEILQKFKVQNTIFCTK